MPITRITTNGTFQLKSSSGYIRALSVPNAGSAWTLQLNDGPSGVGNPTVALYGATPGTITTGLSVFSPIFFSNGIQVITAGTTPGELDVDWI